MCQASTRTCKCGASEASFHFINNILPENVVRDLYCPKCSAEVEFDPESMINDNGWVIDYEIEGAKLFATEFGAAPEEVTPEFIFDHGYCSWVGYTPSDRYDSYEEKKEILELAKTDRSRYFEELKNWSINRVNRLSADGWRKAVRQPSA